MAAMLRIQLGVDDLARLRLAAGGVAATIEAVFSSVALRRADAPLHYGDWEQRMRPRLREDMRPLFALARTIADVPMYLVKRTDDPAVLTEHLLSAPAQPDGGTPFARRVAGGDREARTQLATAVTSYHRAFADVLPAVQALVDADLAYRTALLASDGIGTLLDSLHPAMRWRAGVLELDVPMAGEVDLAGRPVELTPSMFIRDRPGVLIEPDGPCYITYPVRGSLRLADDPGDPLVDLLGRTRAAVLRALRRELTTTELAHRVGISLASASEHTAVLRRGGLILTSRTGRSVRHRLSPLGRVTLAAR